MEDADLAVRQFNDRFRRSAGGGLLHVSPEVQKLGTEALRKIVRRIRKTYRFRTNELAPDLHEAGTLDFNGHRVLWQIEPFNRAGSLADGPEGDGKSDRNLLMIDFSVKP